MKVWDRYGAYRCVWKQSVKWFNEFVLEVANIDCNQECDSDGEGVLDHIPQFESVQNTTHMAHLLQALEPHRLV